MKNQLFILIVCLLSVCSCKKDRCKLKDDRLTPETKTGANTMSCLIEGDVWVASGTRDISNGNCRVGLSFDNKLNQISIAGYTSNACARKNDYVELCIDTTQYVFVNGNRRYPFIQATDSRKGSYAYYAHPFAHYEYYAFKPEHQGWLEFTRFDTVSGVVSGIFEFYADRSTGKIGQTKPQVFISKGRFDINYKKLPPCSNSSNGMGIL